MFSHTLKIGRGIRTTEGRETGGKEKKKKGEKRYCTLTNKIIVTMAILNVKFLVSLSRSIFNTFLLLALLHYTT